MIDQTNKKVNKKLLKENLFVKEKILKNATSYKLRFIDSARFMANAFSNLVDKLTEERHKI